eukprot:ctg_1681.g435
MYPLYLDVRDAQEMLQWVRDNEETANERARIVSLDVPQVLKIVRNEQAALLAEVVRRGLEEGPEAGLEAYSQPRTLNQLRPSLVSVQTAIEIMKSYDQQQQQQQQQQLAAEAEADAEAASSDVKAPSTEVAHKVATQGPDAVARKAPVHAALLRQGRSGFRLDRAAQGGRGGDRLRQAGGDAGHRAQRRRAAAARAGAGDVRHRRRHAGRCAAAHGRGRRRELGRILLHPLRAAASLDGFPGPAVPAGRPEQERRGGAAGEEGTEERSGAGHPGAHRRAVAHAAPPAHCAPDAGENRGSDAAWRRSQHGARGECQHARTDLPA